MALGCVPSGEVNQHQRIQRTPASFSEQSTHHLNLKHVPRSDRSEEEVLPMSSMMRSLDVLETDGQDLDTMAVWWVLDELDEIHFLPYEHEGLMVCCGMID
jgi:hypothetical protein